MATASEIKVTEAYIGLFGRAPNPDGLAYWVAQLDAAGGTTDALKKLTNDMTLNTEWTEGALGSLVEADGSITQANAVTIVEGLYTNLFGRESTEADETYWTAELVAGTVTASEMVVLLIAAAQEKGNADSETLAYKEEAASYYAAGIVEDDFTRVTAKSSVSSVVGPQSLATSKAATDKIASGEGNTVALTATDGDTITMSGGDDVVTGTNATMQTNDTISDASTTDSDTLSITGDGGFTFGTVANVENINVSLSKQLGTTFTLEAAKLSGGDLEITTAGEVVVAGLDVTGSTTVIVNNDSSDISTVGVTDLTVDMLDAVKTSTSISGDASLTALTVTDANDAGVVITMDNDGAGQTVTIDGLDGTNDAASITANNAVTLDLAEGAGGANDIDLLTLSGGSNDVVFTIGDAASAMDITLAGSKSVTVSMDANDAEGLKTTDSSTAGTTNLTLTGIETAADLDLTAVDVDVVTFAGDIISTAVQFNDSQDITLTAGQTTELDLHQTNGNDGTVEVTLSSTTSSFADVELASVGFAELKVNAGDLTVTNLIIDAAASANDANVTVVGTNDISGGAVAGGDGNVTISADALSLGAITGATIDIDAGNDVSIAGATGTGGAVTIDAVGTDGAVTSTGGLISTGGAGNDVTVNAEKLTMAGGVDDITADDITIDLSNDTVSSAIGGDITAANDVTITGGNLDVTGAIVATAGDVTISTTADVAADDLSGDSMTISGAAKLAVENDTTSTGGITITSTCDVDIGSFVGTVVNGGAATGAITIDDTKAETAITLVTGSGADKITMDNDALHTLNSGEGIDTVVITNVGASSVINTAGGADDVTLTEAAVALTVSLGAGDDTISVAADADATIDGGDDTDTVTLASADYADDSLLMLNIEEVNIAAGDSTLSAAQFANDNVFELIGANTLIIEAAATGSTIDASGIEANLGATADLEFTGGAAADTITGHEGEDKVDGEGGADIIKGGEGDDILNGDGGDDNIEGNDDADTIAGDAGNDTLAGGKGADIITGGADNDIITGGDGTDVITGGADSDTMTGGAGADTFAYSAGDSTSAANDTDHIVDFVGGTDEIKFLAGVAYNDLSATDLSGSADLTAAATAAIVADNGTNAVDGQVDVIRFVYGAKTYFLIQADGDDVAYDAATDLLVEVTGVTGTVAIGDFVA